MRKIPRGFRSLQRGKKTMDSMRKKHISSLSQGWLGQAEYKLLGDDIHIYFIKGLYILLWSEMAEYLVVPKKLDSKSHLLDLNLIVNNKETAEQIPSKPPHTRRLTKMLLSTYVSSH